MLTGQLFKFLVYKKLMKTFSRSFYTNFLISKEKNTTENLTGQTTLSNYEPFEEHSHTPILDVEEERRKKSISLDLVEDECNKNQFPGIKRERGVEGVIDLDELVNILRRERAQDLFVARVPPSYRYVQYMVIVNGKSTRHMLGMAEYVRRVYKYKVNSQGSIPSIEGKNSKDWIALDLGNVALHIFSAMKRVEYDLESLWSIGSEFDTLSNQPDDPIIKLLQDSSLHVQDLGVN